MAVAFVLLLLPCAASAQLRRINREFRVNTHTTSSQYSPRVSADADGDFVVAWTSSQDGSETSIRARRFRVVSGALGEEFPVNTYTPEWQSRPDVAVDPAGNFVITWANYAYYIWYVVSDGVRGQRYDSAGAPLGSEFRVTGLGMTPALGADASGNFVVAWTGDGGDPYDIGMKRYQDGTPGAERQANSYWTGHQGLPSVAFSVNGGFLVSWSGDGPFSVGSDAFARRYTSSGLPLNPEFVLNSYRTGDQWVNGLAADSTNFIATWVSRGQDGSGDGIYARRFDAFGAPMGGAFRVNTYTTGHQSYPRVALDGAGGFIVVWQSVGEDGSESGIFGQLYDALGAPQGGNFQVNTYTTGFQRFPAVAATPNGRFVVVWESWGQDGSGSGVFGQRFIH